MAGRAKPNIAAYLTARAAIVAHCTASSYDPLKNTSIDSVIHFLVFIQLEMARSPKPGIHTVKSFKLFFFF